MSDKDTHIPIRGMGPASLFQVQEKLVTAHGTDDRSIQLCVTCVTKLCTNVKEDATRAEIEEAKQRLRVKWWRRYFGDGEPPEDWWE